MLQAHYWESYSHGKPNSDSIPETPPATNYPAFVDRVISQFQGKTVTSPSTSTYKPYLDPEGPAIDPELFNRGATDGTKILFQTPEDGSGANPKVALYKQRIKKIVSAMGAHIGTRRPEAKAVPYTRLRYSWDKELGDYVGEDAHLRDQTARGMFLFQYSPNAFGAGRPGWRMFMEDYYLEQKLFQD